MNITVLRIQNGRMSQVELAKRVGVTPTTVSKWERDDRQITAKHIRSLCKALDTDPNTLLGWEEE